MSRWTRTSLEALGIDSRFDMEEPITEGVIGDKRYLVHLQSAGSSRIRVAISRIDVEVWQAARMRDELAKPYCVTAEEVNVVPVNVWVGKPHLAGRQAVIDEYERVAVNPESKLLEEAL